MIIFNLGALLVGAIAIGVQMLLANLFNIDSDSTLWSFLFFHCALAASIGVELMGLKPRLFFIPTWIISIAMIFMFGDELWGSLSLIYSGLLTAGLIYFFFFWPKHKAANEPVVLFEENKKMLNAYFDNQGTLPDEKKRKLLAVSYSPTTAKNPAIVRHNRAVLDLILERHGELFTREHKELLRENDTILNRFIDGGTDHKEVKKANAQIFNTIVEVLA